jgi:cytochrome c5
MSDASHSHEEEAHEGPIKTPKQLITAIGFSILVPIFAIVLLATYVTTDKRPAAGSDGLGEQATALRIARIGQVEVKDASNPAALKTGEQVYTAQCSGCHAAGMLGAPKFGDAGAWGPRITQGYETLLTSALKGKNSMSAQGGGDYSDVEIGRAVVYMANKGGAKFAEPAVPGAAAPAADAASAAASAEGSAPADAVK